MRWCKVVIVMLVYIGLLFPSEKIIRVYLPTWDDVLREFRPIFGKNLPEVVAGRPNEYYDFIVDDLKIEKVKSTGVYFEIIVDDIEKQKETLFGQYHSYDQIKQILHQMQSSYPSLAKVESIGPSYENRWIYGIKISDNVNIDEDEPELVFSGCHHAREWASIETALFIADTLLRGYGSDPTITQIVNTREIWVFPIINTDGYVYDYPNQRNWRKNRQPFHGYIGTDLNRNYNGTCEIDARGGWGWIPPGGSVTHLPSYETFCGFKGFSAPEIKAYSNFLKNRHAVGIIDFHSYSELVLGAWGHVSDPTPHSTWYTQIGQGIAQRIQRLSGGYYTYQTAYQLYPTSGGSIDWEYGWSHFSNGFPCLAFVNEIGTTFYQPVSQLDHIMRQNFKGALFLMQKGDSIRTYMKCMVPSPRIEPIETVGPNFNLIWHPKNKETNNPSYWEIVKYQNPSPVNESFEGGTNLWNLQNFSLSTARKHTGNYSLFAGNANNVKAQAVTKYPYFVSSPNDSLSFWVWYSLELEYDVAIVEVSEDGRDWYPLVDERYNGDSNGWVRRAYSLAPWLGKSLYFRWRVMTDDNTLNEGFYIDDIYPVANWGVIQTVATQVYDTIYSFTNMPDGTYYFSVRGYNTQFGWGNYSVLEKVVVSSTKIAENNLKENLKVISGNGLKILYSFDEFTPLKIYIYDVSGRNVKFYDFGKLKGEGKISLKLDLSKGIYIIKANPQEKIKVKEFILK